MNTAIWPDAKRLFSELRKKSEFLFENTKILKLLNKCHAEIPCPICGKKFHPLTTAKTCGKRKCDLSRRALRDRIYRRNNKERLDANHKRWFEKNRKTQMERIRKWGIENPEKVKRNRIKTHRRNSSQLPDAYLANMIAKQHGRLILVGRDIPAELISLKRKTILAHRAFKQAKN